MAGSNRREILKKSGLVTTTGLSGILSGCLSENDNGEDGSPEAGNDGAADEQEEEVNLTIGGGGSGSNTYQSALVFQKMMRNHNDRISLTVQETGGTVASYRLYDQGQVDFFSTADYEYLAAHRGEDSYADNPIKNQPYQGFTASPIDLYMVAREDTDIETYDDLPGARVWPQWPEASSRKVSRNVLQEFGLWDEIEVVDMGPGDLAGAISEKRVDAVMVIGVVEQGPGDSSLPGFVQEVGARSGLRALRMSDEQKETIRAMQGRPFRMIEPYGWSQDLGVNELPSIIMLYNMYFGTHLSEDVVYDFISTLREHSEDFYESSAVGPAFDDPDTLAQGVVPEYPVHPGMARAFQEWGVWDDEWEIGEV